MRGTAVNRKAKRQQIFMKRMLVPRNSACSPPPAAYLRCPILRSLIAMGGVASIQPASTYLLLPFSCQPLPKAEDLLFTFPPANVWTAPFAFKLHAQFHD